MKYLVIWKPRAEQRLEELWNSALDPDRILNAAIELARRLRADPDSEGESRDRGRRIAFEPPLGVYFRVIPESETVIVFQVWDY